MNKKYMLCVGLGGVWVALQGILGVLSLEWINVVVINTLVVFGIIMVLQRFMRIGSRQTDSKYYTPTLQQLTEAVDYAQGIMKETGWSLDQYVHRWQDCEDYAERQCTLMKEWFYINVPPMVGYGIGISPFSFIRKDGKGHVLVECYIKRGKSVFFDVYPDHPTLMKLSKKETKTASWTNFKG
jgi:hypothetical protein